MAQSVKYLHEDLNSIPRTRRKAIVVAYICSPSAWEAETERVAVACWPTSLAASASSRPIREPSAPEGILWPTHACTRVCARVHTHNTCESLMCTFLQGGIYRALCDLKISTIKHKAAFLLVLWKINHKQYPAS